ncbi:GNAT family N-acetyltransferase [uncultured Mucilaginibacter sp.]|uniref:GNAT family N-acetyltransferase n=1 Tax=uncultured Mucilaginibacter sp. TaxID=797541 RepID=UPI0025D1C1D6|nr:GNAT family N-acetyltransferase [uncultured Mucilaginibacter sp.]
MKKIVPVSSKKELATFIDFPHDLYKNDPNYVPELFIAQRDLLTTHPFHKHNQLQAFLAFDDDKLIGRIAAILNNTSNEFNHVNDGFWGFFDCIDDQETADLLFNTAANWLKGKGVTQKFIGPVNFSTNEACGLLIKGFDSPPMLMMTYNAPYYETLVEKAGFAKQIDLIAWHWDGQNYDDRSVKLLDALKERLKRNHITIRNVNLKNFKEETVKLREVYNSAWDKNSGFVPLSDEEFNYLAKDLKLILDPDFALVAEQDGKIVGFGLALPNYNEIFKTIKKGRLLPTGLFKLLLNKSKIQSIRIYALGIVDGYRKMGIEACLYGTIIKEYKRKGFTHAEAGWTLENNTMINEAIKAIKGDPYKTYRLYEKAI